MGPAIVLQTQDNCPPGLLGVWAERRGIELDVVRVDRWEHLPAPVDYMFAVVLGSDASVARTRDAWVGRLMEWIAGADMVGLPVLGICFGAQALAAALGGSVVRLVRPEHGWIELSADDPSVIPPGPWLALHEDAIQLPGSAHELARNAFGPQAFVIGPHLGVQFHPEVTPRILSRWVADKNRAMSRDLLVEATECCSVGAISALELFDAFAGCGGARSAQRASAGVGSWDSREAH
jgi:GMP synthase-like glutamine amidotransferase